MTTQGIVRLSEAVTERDHVRGIRTAQVSLVEYGDFECPYCRAAQAIIDGLMKALGDQLSLTFRHFPLREVHPHAQHAAEAAEAANSEGKFWAMHDKLFANQEALDDASLVRYAAEISADSGRVAREIDSHQHASRVTEDYMSGLKSGVNGTPTFYIDGTRYDGPIALRDMLTAIGEQHLELQVAGRFAASPRIPRVNWSSTPAHTEPRTKLH